MAQPWGTTWAGASHAGERAAPHPSSVGARCPPGNLAGPRGRVCPAALALPARGPGDGGRPGFPVGAADRETRSRGRSLARGPHTPASASARPPGASGNAAASSWSPAHVAKPSRFLRTSGDSSDSRQQKTAGFNEGFGVMHGTGKLLCSQRQRSASQTKSSR